MKLWQKSENQLLKEIERFTVGDDYLTDAKIVKQDIMGSIAHSRMLAEIGILTLEEQKILEKGLRKIYKDYQSQNFSISYEDEDVHTKVEKILTQEYGDVGKKLHTARSRNDQVLTDLRLFSKEKILETAFELADTIQHLIDFAERYKKIPMSGYTHMQRAMPSSVGQWAAAFSEELTDLLIFGESIYRLNDACPLGSGAGFGVSLEINREMTARELGFERVQISPIYCQNSRGKIEAQILSWLTGIGLAVNKMATDLVLFSTAEFAYFKLSDTITTGSSIMPQKKNLDVMELVRGKTSLLIGNETAMKSLVTNLISGYHRDLQDTKKLVINSFDTVLDFLAMIRITVKNIEPIEKNLVSAMDKTVFATDIAYDKVKEGVPFREAYQYVGTHLDELPETDPIKNIEGKKHLGATGNLGLELIQKRMNEKKNQFQELITQYQTVQKNLLGG
ncbi:MAG: argininosuccinate lyase [Spirochaetes bacterium GWB1_36_13]|nr:MAG: argininosuccinate lyase [Spirochaetes bacterium GWB1_36_13]